MLVKKKRIFPERLICSSANRALSTARGLAAFISLDENEIQINNRIYAASLETLLDIVQAQPYNCRYCMLVGHNPGLDCLVEKLCGVEDFFQGGGSLSTASMAAIKFDCGWADLTPGSASLSYIVRPEDVDERSLNI